MGYVLSRLSSVCPRFGTAANGESNAVTRYRLLDYFAPQT
jgi:hypothetical protein